MAFQLNGTDLATSYLTKGDLQVTVNSTIWAVGNNGSSQLGIGGFGNYSSPVQTFTGGTNWKQTTATTFGSFGIKNNGTLWAWGGGFYGEMAGTTGGSSPSQIGSSTTWNSISAGRYHIGAVKTDGTLWLWGHNTYGQLGDNTTTVRSSLVQTVDKGTNWKLISCGYYTSMGIKTDGTLWTWGQNGYGQLGDNTTTNRSSPVQTVAGGNNWKYASPGRLHSAAIKTDGTLWLWGNNWYGQLFTGETTSYTSPIQEVTASKWKIVSCGKYYTSAIKADGTLWLAGRNNYGQLGVNDATDRTSPVQPVSGGNNWKYVSAGEQHTVAVKNDGTLWTWGDNSYGQLGDNTSTNRSSPVQTIMSGVNWKAAKASRWHTEFMAWAYTAGW